MSILPTHRQKDWDLALRACNAFAKQGEPRYLDMSIVWDMDTQFGFNTDNTKIVAGNVVRKKLFMDLGFKACKRSEATLLIIIGEKTPEGCWLIGKCKNYWLNLIPQNL
jgi:hypothetical protein